MMRQLILPAYNKEKHFQKTILSMKGGCSLTGTITSITVQYGFVKFFCKLLSDVVDVGLNIVI